jgi:formate dehydrogenase iron-sulfur subunit
MTHSAHASERLTVDGGPAPGTEGVRFGFFTDTSVCIGCKACEVACKEWNHVPAAEPSFTGHSLDNTGALGADAWRHVAFVEQSGVGLEWFGEDPSLDSFRWLMSSDVCKHCTSAACLEVCPTGAIFYTEFSTVVVQDDVCNGCGYCVTACPYGVIERRESDGGAHKCTLCYDRLRDHQQPACAKACPTDSIQFGPLDELRARAVERLDEVVAAGTANAQLYGHSDNGVGGNGAFFLLLDDPEVYGLPPDPVTPTRNLARMWKVAAVAAGALVAGVASAFAGDGR